MPVVEELGYSRVCACWQMLTRTQARKTGVAGGLRRFMRDVRASCREFSCGWNPVDRLEPESKRQWRKDPTRYPHGTVSSRSRNSSKKKIMDAVFWNETFFSWASNWNANSFCKKTARAVALAWQHQCTHEGAHHWGRHQIRWMLPHSSRSTGFSPVSYF